MSLKLFDSLSKTEKDLQPQAQTINMYVCGITPYDFSHIGHARSYICFDLPVRTLTNLCSYQVNYIRNFTDIEDKLLKRAEQELGDKFRYPEIAEKYINDFHAKMAKFNCLAPTHEPRATQYIPEMIEFIEKLLEKNIAYRIEHDIYLDISKVPDYGKLSKKNLDELVGGARVSQALESKRNPGDFVLWKGNDQQEFWPAPFGYGRPGWHLECSAMVNKHCPNQSLDIHGGGADLIFPHHENEIAQSESVHSYPLAKIWMHNGFLNINNEKMSKSLGNFLTIEQILEKYTPVVFRFYILQHHYRSPIDFSPDKIGDAQKALSKLKIALNKSTETTQDSTPANNEILEELKAALLEDLNSPKAIGLIFKHLDLICKNAALQKSVKHFVEEVLGLNLDQVQETEQAPEITPEIQALLDQRVEARQNKNWALADQLRDQLKALGYQVQDKK